MERIDCLVVGAGVVGLAVARRLAQGGREALVVDAGEVIGCGSSSRNSEVIHAGIYYPPDWLKTRLCVAGRRQLYDYCEARGVPYRKTGKVIVATEEAERPALEQLLARAHGNGLTEVRRLSGGELAELEPEVRAVAGLFSPETGIVDSHQLMLALEGDLEAAGGMVALNTRIAAGRVDRDAAGIVVELEGDEDMTLQCQAVVNAAGLGAQAFASALGLPPAHVPALHLARGQYYTLAGPHPFRHLVYPMPAAGGLGVHVTLDLAGQVRFGPDVHWLDSEDYTFDERPLPAVADAIRRYWPGVPADRLAPGYTGIRTKLSGPGEPNRDFVISGPAEHGVPGLVCLYGIESPGLTAALAIADRVVDLLG
jgi:L-2-hydroxyglutarate oxidase LhgO